MPVLPSKIDRRDFLKYVGAGLGTLAFRPFYQDPGDRVVTGGTGKVVRVATTNISVYKEPWDESQILYQRFRNDLMNVYFEVISEHGPGYNPKWYRVWGGYVHSASAGSGNASERSGLLGQQYPPSRQTCGGDSSFHTVTAQPDG